MTKHAETHNVTKAFIDLERAIKSLDRAYIENGNQVAGKLSTVLSSLTNLTQFGPAYIPQIEGVVADLVKEVSKEFLEKSLAN